MSTITLFEHQEIEYSQLGWEYNSPYLAALEKLNAKSQVELFYLGRKSLKARHFVGVVRISDLTLQVLPKIDWTDIVGGSQSDASRHATQNLMTLLRYAQNITIHARDYAELGSQHSDWFELLTYFLALELHTQMKQGVDQNYVRTEDRVSALRGTWHIGKHILRPGHERHLFDVSYDEFIPDTPLNQLFAYVVNTLLTVTRDATNKRLLRDISTWLLSVTCPRRVMPSDLARIEFTRLNERFRSAFNWACLFLEGLTPQLQVEHEQLFAFMFDMNILFERFVAGFIKRHKESIFPEADIQVIAQSEGRSVYLAERLSDGRRIFQLRPDLMFVQTDSVGQLRTVGVVDTKYKKLDLQNRKYGVAEDDFYQMTAYALRFGCPRVLLLYPQTVTVGDIQEEFVIVEPGYHISINTINLRQPLHHPDPLITAFRSILTPYFQEIY